jgi:hypothetical protein
MDDRSRVIRQMARGMVRAAVLNGLLIRGTCEVCGEENTEGHHDDYDRPLDVRWFCKAHHEALHKNGGPKPTASSNPLTPLGNRRQRFRSEQLNIRVTPEEKAEIQTAAEARETTVTDLMVSATLDKVRRDGRPFVGTLRRMLSEGES